jgi:hypothetical protein
MASERVSPHTSDRVDTMSDEARAELARSFADKKRGVTDEGFRKAVTTPYESAGRAHELDEETAAEVVRLTAELNRTNRRLDRMERGVSHGRYQTGSAAPPNGRYARLLSRVERLERELRALR